LLDIFTVFQTHLLDIQGDPNVAHFSYALTSSNIYKFSNLFHC